MIGDVLLYAVIAAIAAIVAIILAAAWAEFGHVAHARTWAGGFAILSAGSAVEAAGAWNAAAPPAPGAVLLAGGGFVAAMSTAGFRQRAGLRPNVVGLLLAAVAPAACVALLAARGATGGYAWPFCLFNALMSALALRTLKGRRRSERRAEYAAHVALVAAGLGSLALLSVPLARAWLGSPPARAALLLAGPAAVTGLGLFATFLIAADLADRVRRLARTDMLTGLLNRRGFEEAAASAIAAREPPLGPALLMIDIDRFKRVNDRFGHPAGDRVIALFAACLARGTASRDLVARIGGEEFAILLAFADKAAARDVAERLRARVAALDFGLEAPLSITASFGVAASEEANTTLAEMLERADRALYRAKAAGRNRVTVATLLTTLAPLSALTIYELLIPRAIGA